MINTLRFLLLIWVNATLAVLGVAQDTARVQVEWLYDNLSHTEFRVNPDTSSKDQLIDLYLSGPEGTLYHPTINTQPQQFSYRLSGWTPYVEMGDTILIETEAGLAFALRDGTVLWQTPYERINQLEESGHWIKGVNKKNGQTEIFNLTDQQVVFRRKLEEGESLSYEGGYFKVSGYEHSTRFYNTTGELVLEETEKTIVALATDEPRFHVTDNRLFKSWIADVDGNVLADLPRNTFQVKGEGSRMMVQTGAFKKAWLDLAGQTITDPITEALIPGEIEIIRNCGSGSDMGAVFHHTGVELACSYQSIALAWPDSSIIQAKQNRASTFFKRDGSVLFDPGPYTVSRYLGGDFFVLGGGGNCAFVRANGQVVVQTEVYVKDPISVAYANYLPDSRGGKLVIATKNANKMMVYDTSGALLFVHESPRFKALRWSKMGDDLKITEGTQSFIVNRQGERVADVTYRNPQYFFREGELKYIITNEIYRDRVNANGGVNSLLDGVATHLVDAVSGEVIVSANTGMRWIDDNHLLLYFGRRQAIVRLMH